MQSLLILINGIRLPFYLVEYAIQQAKGKNASVHVLFLKGAEDIGSGYAFPSDLTETVTLTESEDAKSNDESIIRHNMKLTENMAAADNIQLTTKLMTEASLSEVSEIMKAFDLVYLDKSFDEETPSMLTSNRFTSKDLIEQATVSIEILSEER